MEIPVPIVTPAQHHASAINDPPPRRGILGRDFDRPEINAGQW